MKSFVFLLRREFWENRGAFLTTPVVMGGVFLFLTLAVLAAAAILVTEIDGEKFMLSKAIAEAKNMSPAHLDTAWDIQLMSLAAIFNMVLFVIIFFYLLGALHDDRKDRSILFWKSLPISDTRTVLSKLVAASFLAPVLWVGAIAATHIGIMLIATGLAWNAGLSAGDFVWGPADPIEVWGLLLLAYFVQAFWILPVYGWLLLASAFAKSRPFLWAMVPPILLIFFQSWLNATRYFRFDNQIAEVIGGRLLGGVLPLALNEDGDNTRLTSWRFVNGEFRESPVDLTNSLSRFAEAEMWWGILVGVIFLAAAIYIRRYRDDV